MARRVGQLHLSIYARQALGRVLLWLDEYNARDQMEVSTRLFEWLTEGKTEDLPSLWNVRAIDHGRPDECPPEMRDLLEALGIPKELGA